MWLNTNDHESYLNLIDQLTSPFNLNKFKDTYSVDLQNSFTRKRKQKKKEDAEPKLKVTHHKAKPEDLMTQLKASLQKAS